MRKFLLLFSATIIVACKPSYNPGILKIIPWEKTSTKNKYKLPGTCNINGPTIIASDKEILDQAGLIESENNYNGEIFVFLNIDQQKNRQT